ncbi:acid protease [Annulohypoxylon bovei var. microspora]|nr:acid protease [Annulohypoxylon bovei var. microspora]
MAYFSSILVAVAFCLSLFTTANSSSAFGSKAGKTFSLAVAHNADVPRHGPTEYLKTLKKYKLEIPEGLQDVVDTHKTNVQANKAVAGDIASHAGDLLWLTPVGIGSPPQQLYLDIDTGSSDTWIFSTDTDKEEVAGQTLWDPHKSSTSQLIRNCSWSIIYGDFSTSSGICYKDTVTFGNLSVPGMTIESATSVSSMFTESDYMSGLVGLGWPSIVQTIPKQKTLLDYLPQVLTEPVFTADLRHNSSEGSFNFGFINNSLHDSDIQYVGVNISEGYWSVQQSGFSIGGSDIKYEFNEPEDVIIDTGSTLFFAPNEAVHMYFNSVPGANYSYREYGWLIPCNSTPPDFIFELSDAQGNNITGSVPGAYFIYAKASGGQCYAGLQSLGSFTEMPAIFGDVFLKSGFAVFDIANQRFGMAPKPLNTSNEKRKRKVDARGEIGDHGGS